MEERAEGTGVYVVGTPTADSIALQSGVVPLVNPPPAAGTIITARAGTTVTISAVRSKVFSGSKVPGKFVLRRTGTDVSKPLRVVYRVQGSAVAGRDYRSIRRVRTIPAGHSTASIMVRPVGSRFGKLESRRVRVVIRLRRQAGYRLGKQSTAKVRIIDRSFAAAPQG